ncbi:hypothetical protein POJ06DRAFT_19387 [Lipomyces tetrasporus]|uniref:BZIP domain-containing protein n=1 Tax=Lipomyces tetrasporus TaxID=54092 RepID=A0AAD7VPD0_9ASCO|nr:uncharacterized protein POJ06DRAFT_19387 [Lipomyces tetrasporus]KAJ8097657.1 hypothetical protein POJ06DRAFT_19387 [Lipomyces tetrasporus]
MEYYSHWSSQRPSPLSLPSVYSSVSKDNNFQLELVNGMDHSGIYQGFGTDTTFPRTPISPVTTIEPDSISHAGSQSSMAHRSEPAAQCQRYHHRRKQNREAQRRFRKRKADHQKDLQQKILDLEEKCQELSDGIQQKPDDVAQLLKDKEALKSENQNLRKLCQTMVLLMEQLEVLRSLSNRVTLLTTNPPSPCASPELQPSTDGSSLCLDALSLILKHKDKRHGSK